MQKYAIGLLTAAAAMVAADVASATCSASQIDGTWSLVGIQPEAPASFRCPAFTFASGSTRNHFSVSGACVEYTAGGGGTFNYNISGKSTIVVNPTNCKAFGTFTRIFTGGGTGGSSTATILLFQFADPGAGTARQAHSVVRLGTDNGQIDFTLMR